MSWKEYDDSNIEIADWLPWEGLIHPNVLKNKDESLLAVLKYNPLPWQTALSCEIPELPNGWVIWTERQHFPEFECFFLSILWCPHVSSGRISNLPDEEGLEKFSFEASEENIVNGFIETVWLIAQAIASFTDCHWLKNQEIIDFLSDTLTNSLQLPPELAVSDDEDPIDIDDKVSRFSGIYFHGNYINIENKAFIIASLPGGASKSDMYALYDRFWDMNFRHTQRLLCFSREKAEKELKRYTAKWCPSRSSIKELICNDILKKINGYYSNMFIFVVEEKEIDSTKEYIDHVFRSLQLNEIIEDYNFKDVWWGSLVGIYRANVPNPPITGFQSISELLMTTMPKKG